MKGTLDDLRPLKWAIILETYAELLDILDDYACRFGSGGKAVRQGMAAIVSDPDVLGRFNSDRQTQFGPLLSDGLSSLREGLIGFICQFARRWETLGRGASRRPHGTDEPPPRATVSCR